MQITLVYIIYIIIKCVNGETKCIIATQGPLQPTLSHFWRMIHQENFNVIVMLCNLKENGKVITIYNLIQQAQCEQYWPKEPGTSMTCGPTTIRLENTEEHGPALVHRHFRLSHENDMEER